MWDGALTFDEANDLGDRILGRNGDQHVNMVYHEMPFQYFALLLSGKGPKHLPQMLPELCI